MVSFSTDHYQHVNTSNHVNGWFAAMGLKGLSVNVQKMVGVKMRHNSALTL